MADTIEIQCGKCGSFRLTKASRVEVGCNYTYHFSCKECNTLYDIQGPRLNTNGVITFFTQERYDEISVSAAPS